MYKIRKNQLKLKIINQRATPFGKPQVYPIIISVKSPITYKMYESTKSVEAFEYKLGNSQCYLLI